MTINRINYEAYALDYLEGTLPEDLKQEMELFLRQNPATKEIIQAPAPVIK
jgi:hypothetical protein